MPEAASADFRERVAAAMRSLQDSICAGLEALELERDGTLGFHEDTWAREGGGGGRTRVIADAAVFEKGGVNFSEVHGEFSPEYATQVPGSGREFWACGVSLVLHPRNPHVPTCHANFRMIEHGDKAWFGGGADLTPYYFHREDRDHFHAVWREVCEAHPGIADYPGWSAWCDRYFFLPHRGERRGVGGIFFDNLWIDAAGSSEASREHRDRAEQFVFAAGHRFLAAYVPIVERRIVTPWTEAERAWQEIRRGRYVEFNLVYDRGTIFGLKTGGRTESILMSLPPRARWVYDHQPEPGSREAALLDELRDVEPR